jgi:hypothetical protein
MWNFLDKLREKNDAQKLVITMVVSVLLTFVITATWIASISVSNKTEEDKSTADIREEVTPISNFTQQVGEIKSMFGQIVSEYRTSKAVLEELPAIIEESENIENSTEIVVENATNSTTTIEIESSVE